MKWLIASDLHGSALYGRQLLEAFDREGAGRLLLLGDLLYHGPRNALPGGYGPKEVIFMLNAGSRGPADFCHPRPQIPFGRAAGFGSGERAASRPHSCAGQDPDCRRVVVSQPWVGVDSQGGQPPGVYDPGGGGVLLEDPGGPGV